MIFNFFLLCLQTVVGSLQIKTLKPEFLSPERKLKFIGYKLLLKWGTLRRGVHFIFIHLNGFPVPQKRAVYIKGCVSAMIIVIRVDNYWTWDVPGIVLSGIFSFNSCIVCELVPIIAMILQMRKWRIRSGNDSYRAMRL